MVKMHWPVLLASFLNKSLLAEALITLGDIRELANVTAHFTQEIVAIDQPILISNGPNQFHGERDKAEIEDIVAAALNSIDGMLLEMLNVPISGSEDDISHTSCPSILTDYHAFLAATVRFLQAVDEKQQEFRWSGDSTVFHGISWMQALWASRKPNEQNFSFIEQQLKLYAGTGCFGKNEVLRQDVELVEYMNDLIDSFN